MPSPLTKVIYLWYSPSMEVDYPSDIIEFSSQFSTEEACFSYLNRIRWPKGFVCPHCLQNGGWWLEKHLRFECKACHRQTSPLSGTLLHRSHFPLRLWFWAAYFVSTHTPGMSAVQLQRQLSIVVLHIKLSQKGGFYSN